ncbi:hypothetical protein Tco_0686243, partial [Tanacetum coccineum]
MDVTVATIDKEFMRDLERDVGYGITDTWDEMLVDMPGAPMTDDTELGRRMTNFVTTVRQDTYEIYARLDDEQTERQLMAGRLNMLYRDRRAHARTGQQAVITELQAADRMRQAMITELLAADRRRQAQFIEALKLLKRLQTQMTEFESQQEPAKGQTMDEMLVDMPGAPVTDDTELGRRMTKFATRVRQDTNEIYVRLDDEQTERHLMAGRLNMLYRDRRAHARIAGSDYRVAASGPQETGDDYRVADS